MRVVSPSDGPLQGDPSAVVRALQSFGVHCEVMQRPVRMVALDIPPDVPLAPVKALLRRGAATDGGCTRRLRQRGMARAVAPSRREVHATTCGSPGR